MSRFFNVRITIVVVATILVFSNILDYLALIGVFTTPSYITFPVLLGLIIIYYIIYKNKHPFNPVLNNIIFIWVVYYLLTELLYFMASPAGPLEYKALKINFFSLFLGFFTVMALGLDDSKLTITRKTMLGIALFSVVTFLMEFFNIGFASSVVTGHEKIGGRAAGLYINANGAAGALIFLYVFTIDLIPKRIRIFYVLFVFLGVLVTFSRSGMLIYILITLLMFFYKKINGVHLLLSLVSIVFVLSFLTSGGGIKLIEQKTGIELGDFLIDRVSFFTEGKLTDSSANLRKEVLNEALDFYANNPVLGKGYIATRKWSYDVAPHNTYAKLLAEKGLVGLSIIIFLLFFSTYYLFKYGAPELKKIAILIIIYFLLKSFFSHNMIEQPYNIGLCYVLSVLGVKSKLDFFKLTNKQ